MKPMKQTDRHIDRQMSLTKYVEELNQSGFTVMHDIYTSTDIEDMKQAYTEIRNKANDILNTTCAYERRWYENDQETVSKYWKYKEYSSSKFKLKFCIASSRGTIHDIHYSDIRSYVF